MHNRERIPKYTPDINLFGNGFEATGDYFSDADRDEWAIPGHIDMNEIPNEAVGRFPSPEDIAIAREEFGDRIKEFIGDDTDNNSDDFDIWNDHEWREELGELGYDEERFEAAGYYRGRAGEIFIYTPHQFFAWEGEDYAKREADKLSSEYLASKPFNHDTKNRYLEKSEDVQKEFDEQCEREINQRATERYDCKPSWNTRDGDRQLGSKRKSRGMRRFHKVIGKITDLDIAA